MGNTVVWKPASTAAYSRALPHEALRGGRAAAGRDQPRVRRPARRSAIRCSRARDLAGVHFTGSTAVFQSMWKTIGANIASYRNYPRIVGETGGKDFIVAHPSADAEAVATAIVRGGFEYQGQKCSAASRVFAPSNPLAGDPRAAGRGDRTIKVGDVARLPQLHGRRHRRRLVQDTEGGDRRGQGGRQGEVLVGGSYDDSRRLLRRADACSRRGSDFRTMRRSSSARS